jgi:hypothetical protein
MYTFLSTGLENEPLSDPGADTVMTVLDEVLAYPNVFRAVRVDALPDWVIDEHIALYPDILDE